MRVTRIHGPAPWSPSRERGGRRPEGAAPGPSSMGIITSTRRICRRAGGRGSEGLAPVKHWHVVARLCAGQTLPTLLLCWIKPRACGPAARTRAHSGTCAGQILPTLLLCWLYGAGPCLLSQLTVRRARPPRATRTVRRARPPRVTRTVRRARPPSHSRSPTRPFELQAARLRAVWSHGRAPFKLPGFRRGSVPARAGGRSRRRGNARRRISAARPLSSPAEPRPAPPAGGSLPAGTPARAGRRRASSASKVHGVRIWTTSLAPPPRAVQRGSGSPPRHRRRRRISVGVRRAGRRCGDASDSAPGLSQPRNQVPRVRRPAPLWPGRWRRRPAARAALDSWRPARARTRGRPALREPRQLPS